MAANGNHRPLGLAIRLVGVAVVIVAAIAVKELVLDTTPAPSHTAGSKVVDYTVDSKLLGEEVPVSVVVPPGARDGLRSLLVFLHGRGDDEQSYLTDPMFRGLARQGGPAPVVAFPRGGPDSYWHDRDDGAWGSFVLEELIPALVKRFEIEPEQIGIGGISMGGFGALDIAARSPGTFCAVGAHSPAVWLDASDTAQGAFDDEEDFAAHDVASELAPPGSPLAGKRVWLDVGDEDPFLEATRKLAETLSSSGARVSFSEGHGGHENDYWDANWRRYMRFYATALKECRVKPGDGNGQQGSEGGAGTQGGA